MIRIILFILTSFLIGCANHHLYLVTNSGDTTDYWANFYKKGEEHYQHGPMLGLAICGEF